MKRRWRHGLIGLVVLTASAPFMAPEVLAFPYRQEFGTDQVWSTAPIPHERMAAILADANARVRSSPIARVDEGRRIFLTDGGWRWRLLALRSHFAFALTRAFREDVILNESDMLTDKVSNGLNDGRTRSVAGVIAHEKVHGTIRRHFGAWVDLTRPVWVREGYCDYVAQESTLTDAEVVALKKSNPKHPAIPYYEGHMKVSAILAANGGNVDKLFAEAR